MRREHLEEAPEQRRLILEPPDGSATVETVIASGELLVPPAEADVIEAGHPGREEDAEVRAVHLLRRHDLPHAQDLGAFVESDDLRVLAEGAHGGLTVGNVLENPAPIASRKSGDSNTMPGTGTHWVATRLTEPP